MNLFLQTQIKFRKFGDPVPWLQKTVPKTIFELRPNPKICPFEPQNSKPESSPAFGGPVP